MTKEGELEMMVYALWQTDGFTYILKGVFSTDVKAGAAAQKLNPARKYEIEPVELDQIIDAPK